MEGFETDSTRVATSHIKSSSYPDSTEYKQNVMNICSDMSNLKILSPEDENVQLSDKCEICDVVLTSPIMAKQHFEGGKHLRNKKIQSQTEPIIPNSTPENSFLSFPTPVDSPLNNQYKCEICDVVFTSRIIAKQHFEGGKHLRNKKIQSQTEPILPNSTPENSFLSFPTPVDSPLNNHYKCEICDVVFTSRIIAKQHFEGKKHLKKTEPILSNSTPEISSVCFDTPANLSLKCQDKCEMCGVVYTSNTNAIEHLQGKNHLKNSKALSAYKIGNKLECDICCVVFAGVADADAHIIGKKHQKAIENGIAVPKLSTGCFPQKTTSLVDENFPQKTSSLVDENFPILNKCDICDVVFTSQIIAKQHFEGKRHLKKNIQSQTEPILSQTEPIHSNSTPVNSSLGLCTPADLSLNIDYKCEICNVLYTSKPNAIDHLKGKNHLKNIKMISNLKTISNDSVQCTDKECSMKYQSHEMPFEEPLQNNLNVNTTDTASTMSVL